MMDDKSITELSIELNYIVKKLFIEICESLNIDKFLKFINDKLKEK